MDHWEAHYLIKWEREAIIARHALAAFVSSKSEEQTTADDLTWLGQQWLKDDDD
jgi:hypothetical protein